MNAVEQARIAYVGANRAWQDARAAMLDSTRQRGDFRHDPGQWRAVDKLHKALNKAAIAYHKAQFDAGLIPA